MHACVTDDTTYNLNVLYQLIHVHVCNTHIHVPQLGAVNAQNDHSLTPVNVRQKDVAKCIY